MVGVIQGRTSASAQPLSKMQLKQKVEASDNELQESCFTIIVEGHVVSLKTALCKLVLKHNISEGRIARIDHSTYVYVYCSRVVCEYLCNDIVQLLKKLHEKDGLPVPTNHVSRVTLEPQDDNDIGPC